jgi:hypothetical protein
MPNVVEKQVKFRHVLGQISTFTHSEWEIFLNLVDVHILEFEDVLFHHDSAVMMPENPKGKSSRDGRDDDSRDADDKLIKEGQKLTTGVKALALAFKELEINPDRRILIAAHADTSGKAKYNFKLSRLRALNVFYLLTENRYSWALNSAEKHKIEDYQQIMKYYYYSKFAKGSKFFFDPGKRDDTWGPKTESATENFIEFYNGEFLKDKPGLLPIAKDNAMKEVRDSQKKHRWATELWEAVYELYSHELAEGLCTNREELVRLRRSMLPAGLDEGKFLYVNRRYVACGESFPIDDSEKKNYRSQENRRVEILFFDKEEALDIKLAIKEFEVCSKIDTEQTHKEKDCPLWNHRHLRQLYITPGDLYAVVYHMSFRYFDPVVDDVASVPQGLTIQAFENGGDGLLPDELDTTTRWENGTYFVKVEFKTPLNDGSHKSLHFEFRTENEWVHRPADGTDPRIDTMTPEDIQKLSLEERQRYYDLPARWSSRHYWTRYKDMSKGERFEKVIKDEKLKPFGNQITSASEPLVFSLDDIVLLDDKSGNQDIKDANHENRVPTKDHPSGPEPLDLNRWSRVKIFVVNERTGFLTLYRTDDSKKSSARIRFSENEIAGNPNPVFKNLIAMMPGELKCPKIVFFRDGFYTVAANRTEAVLGWEKMDGFVVGARAAIRNDADYHVRLPMFYSDNEFGSTGDYELHYFHHLGFVDQHPISYLVYYVSISFMQDSRDPAYSVKPPVNPIPSANDVRKYVDEGIYNAMEEWNKKCHFFEEDPRTENSTLIRPFYFFDERETFVVTPPSKGFKIDFDRDTTDPLPPGPPPPGSGPTDYSMLFIDPRIRRTQQMARGGRSKYLALIIGDTDGHWGPAYHRRTRRAVMPPATSYSLFKLNKSGYNLWPGGYTVTEDGDTYGFFIFAHELGHATGRPDEYVYKNYCPDPNQKKEVYPDFKLAYVTYSMSTNRPSMMYHSCAPHLHHMWYALHKINREIKNASPQFSKMLGGKTFVGRLVRGSSNITYTRKIGATGQPQIKDKMTDWIVGESSFILTEPSDIHHQGPLRRLSLELYDVGKDESSIQYFHEHQAPVQYQGVLVVRVLLKVVFSNDEGAWTNAEKRTKVHDINQEFIGLGGHYRLKGGAHDMKNIYIHFLPGFTDSAAQTSQHYVLKFLKKNYPGTGDFFPNAAGTVTVYDNATADKLIDYFLNVQTTRKDALLFLRNWVNNKLSILGENFSLEEF